MQPIVRLTVLVLMSFLPLACGPTASHADAVVPTHDGNVSVVRSACVFDGPRVLARCHVLVRAGHITAKALGTAIRATTGAFSLADRGRIAPDGRVFKNGFDVRRTPGQAAAPQGR